MPRAHAAAVLPEGLVRGGFLRAFAGPPRRCFPMGSSEAAFCGVLQGRRDDASRWARPRRLPTGFSNGGTARSAAVPFCPSFPRRPAVLLSLPAARHRMPHEHIPVHANRRAVPSLFRIFPRARVMHLPLPSRPANDTAHGRRGDASRWARPRRLFAGFCRAAETMLPVGLVRGGLLRGFAGPPRRCFPLGSSEAAFCGVLQGRRGDASRWARPRRLPTGFSNGGTARSAAVPFCPSLPRRPSHTSSFTLPPGQRYRARSPRRCFPMGSSEAAFCGILQGRRDDACRWARPRRFSAGFCRAAAAMLPVGLVRGGLPRAFAGSPMRCFPLGSSEAGFHGLLQGRLCDASRWARLRRLSAGFSNGGAARSAAVPFCPSLPRRPGSGCRAPVPAHANRRAVPSLFHIFLPPGRTSFFTQPSCQRCRAPLFLHPFVPPGGRDSAAFFTTCPGGGAARSLFALSAARPALHLFFYTPPPGERMPRVRSRPCEPAGSPFPFPQFPARPSHTSSFTLPPGQRYRARSPRRCSPKGSSEAAFCGVLQGRRGGASRWARLRRLPTGFSNGGTARSAAVPFCPSLPAARPYFFLYPAARHRMPRAHAAAMLPDGLVQGGLLRAFAGPPRRCLPMGSSEAAFCGVLQGRRGDASRWARPRRPRTAHPPCSCARLLLFAAAPAASLLRFPPRFAFRAAHSCARVPSAPVSSVPRRLVPRRRALYPALFLRGRTHRAVLSPFPTHAARLSCPASPVRPACAHRVEAGKAVKPAAARSCTPGPVPARADASRRSFAFSHARRAPFLPCVPCAPGLCASRRGGESCKASCCALLHARPCSCAGGRVAPFFRLFPRTPRAFLALRPLCARPVRIASR